MSFAPNPWGDFYAEERIIPFMNGTDASQTQTAELARAVKCSTINILIALTTLIGREPVL